MDNMILYNIGKDVPDSAKKSIGAGRLKGMTDINPMWRISKLTEIFGPCGVGWWYEITDKRIVLDEITGQKAAFVDILLFYVDPESGEASHGIPGTGGAAFVSKEKNGPYMSDECYKMALTDAISVSTKALGIGASVYWTKGESKYNGHEEQVKMETVEDAAGFVLNFGKNSGKTLGELFKSDKQYVEWLYNGEKTDPVVKKAIGILLQAIKESRGA